MIVSVLLLKETFHFSFVGSTFVLYKLTIAKEPTAKIPYPKGSDKKPNQKLFFVFIIFQSPIIFPFAIRQIWTMHLWHMSCFYIFIFYLTTPACIVILNCSVNFTFSTLHYLSLMLYHTQFHPIIMCSISSSLLFSSWQ